MVDRYRGAMSRRNALIAESAEATDGEELRAFLRALERCHAVTGVPSRDGGYDDEAVSSLGLALASLECDQLHRQSPLLLPQIALLGPTQAGKSSLANGVLGRDLAEVSPLAGFTIHPQGFCWGAGTEQTIRALNGFFRPLQRVAADQLPRDRFDCYALADVGALDITPPVPAACLWDTPDFDSVDAAHYRGHVLRIAALADLAILVLSKDKYSDESVWDMVSLLQPLGHPTAIILNKVDEASRDALLASLEEKWRSCRVDSLPFVVTLPFVEAANPSLPPAAVDGLARWIHRKLASASRQARRKRTRELLERHWSGWLAPVRAEQQARAEWDGAIHRGIEEVVVCYQRDYLNHPHHYETFQRALARLLTLLEVPGVAGAVASARRLLTWPFRQATRLGRRVMSGTADRDPKSGEQAILEQLIDHLLLQLQQLVLAKREQDPSGRSWWRDLSSVFRAAQEEFKAETQEALADYAGNFQVEIDQTARALYQRLETRPVVLNSLRATRMTTDAAALAFALHSGGIGIQDFVIAPATLSLTSMLTESALGHYVNRAAEDLKSRQLVAVGELLRATLGDLLRALPDRLDDSRHCKLSAATVERAGQRLAAYG